MKIELRTYVKSVWVKKDFDAVQTMFSDDENILQKNWLVDFKCLEQCK